MNIFFEEYDTPFGTVPFDKIKMEDYESAFMKGMEEEDKEIDAIVNNEEEPTFENTIVALCNTGKILGKVSVVFYNLMSADTNDDMDALAQKISPLLSQHSANISFNERLFQRIKAVYDSKPTLDLEEQKLLDVTYDGFVRSGANLSSEKKEEVKKLISEMSVTCLKFSQNKLKEMNAFTLHITDEADLDGLPESSIESASQEAADRNLDGWVFTLQSPSMNPFMRFSTKRELRRQLYMAYNTICTHDNEYNNFEHVRTIVNLSRKHAQILGHKTYSDMRLQKRMAQNCQNVYKLLNDLIDAYMPKAKDEMEHVSALVKEMEGDDFVLQPWDFTFYSNKLKEKDYNFNSETLRPYFELSKVKEGVFGLATKLYGITFHLNKNIPVFHPDVEAYEVHDRDGSYLAVFYCDFHPRKSKQSGAWMTNFKEQWIEKDGTNSRPHVSITMNVTKPTESKPALLTLSEVETFLHEFGHSLHGMFANTRFKALSGTGVYLDFVELPSQIMENFATEREWLNTFARHYETGELIPDDLIDKIQKSRNFNVAYACMRQVSFGLLDMAYYTLEDDLKGDIIDFEQKAWSKAQLLPSVEGTCLSVQFSHIMSGGYSSGYYSYKWAEVLDADAFSLFKQNGIFDQATAQSFRENILSRGGTEHPMTLYKRFRGQEPTIDALVERNGIKR